MHKFILRFAPVLFAMVAFLSGGQSFAATCSPPEEGTSCTNAFDANNTVNTYEFFGDGRITVQFESVLVPFDLTVTINHVIDPLDPKEFPTGTVCVQYEFNGNQCTQYDFSGTSSGPNNVPVKNKDYKGLITLTLVYDTVQTINDPAFGHAPGDNASAVYSEDILSAYSSSSGLSDPTMRGKTPSLSSVAALDEPLNQAGHFCGFEDAPVEGNSLQEGEDVEIAFRLVAGTGPTFNCTPPAGIRDKTATFTLWTFDGDGNVFFPPIVAKEEGNKFHWDSKNGVDELDLSTKGLVSGQTYHITVMSTKFPPQDKTFVPGP